MTIQQRYNCAAGLEKQGPGEPNGPDCRIWYVPLLLLYEIEVYENLSAAMNCQDLNFCMRILVAGHEMDWLFTIFKFFKSIKLL